MQETPPRVSYTNGKPSNTSKTRDGNGAWREANHGVTVCARTHLAFPTCGVASARPSQVHQINIQKVENLFSSPTKVETPACPAAPRDPNIWSSLRVSVWVGSEAVPSAVVAKRLVLDRIVYRQAHARESLAHQ